MDGWLAGFIKMKPKRLRSVAFPPHGDSGPGTETWFGDLGAVLPHQSLLPFAENPETIVKARQG